MIMKIQEKYVQLTQRPTKKTKKRSMKKDIKRKVIIHPSIHPHRTTKQTQHNTEKKSAIIQFLLGRSFLCQSNLKKKIEVKIFFFM